MVEETGVGRGVFACSIPGMKSMQRLPSWTSWSTAPVPERKGVHRHRRGGVEKCPLVTPRKCTNHKGNHLPSYNCPRLSSSAPLGQWSVEFCAACGQRPCSVDQDGLSTMRQPGLGEKKLTNFFFFLCKAERLGRSGSASIPN